MLKNQHDSGFALIDQLFESAFARKRIAADYLSIILVPFVQDLFVHGYARATIPNLQEGRYYGMSVSTTKLRHHKSAADTAVRGLA